MKKKNLLTLLAVLCAAAIVVTVCLLLFKDNTKYAVTYYDPNEKVTGTATQGLASLLIGSFKAGSAEYISYIEALPDGWDSPADGKDGASFREQFKEECIMSLKKLLAVEYLHDNVYGIEISTEQQRSVDDNIANLTKALGGNEAFETQLQVYGATADDYERYLILMLKQSNLTDFLYGEGGERQIADEQIKSYFSTNYVIVEHIFFEMRGTKKDDGTTVSFTEEERNIRRNNAHAVYNGILDGTITYEDAFYSVNEDLYVSSFPNGYFVADNGQYPAEFVRAAFSLKTGEITMVETTSGIHIMRKKPMNADLYNTDSEVYAYIASAIRVADFNELVSTVIDGAKADDNIIAELDAGLIAPFYFFS